MAVIHFAVLIMAIICHLSFSTAFIIYYLLFVIYYLAKRISALAQRSHPHFPIIGDQPEALEFVGGYCRTGTSYL